MDALWRNAIDYGVVVKEYGNAPGDERRYSPATCLSEKKYVVCGDPDESLVSTSYVERQNLTMRMNIRRYTRLTNGFSKKAENHAHATALHFAYTTSCDHIRRSRNEPGARRLPLWPRASRRTRGASTNWWCCWTATRQSPECAYLSFPARSSWRFVAWPTTSNARCEKS